MSREWVVDRRWALISTVRPLPTVHTRDVWFNEHGKRYERRADSMFSPSRTDGQHAEGQWNAYPLQAVSAVNFLPSLHMYLDPTPVAPTPRSGRLGPRSVRRAAARGVSVFYFWYGKKSGVRAYEYVGVRCDIFFVRQQHCGEQPAARPCSTYCLHTHIHIHGKRTYMRARAIDTRCFSPPESPTLPSPTCSIWC